MEWNEYFDLWVQYEEIAKHFNELIIRNRLQALGGVAATATVLVGFFAQKAISKGDDEQEIAWGGLAAVFALLTVFWSALCALDILYYNQLLQGSVNAIVALENESVDNPELHQIDLSKQIEDTVQTLEFPFLWHEYQVSPGVAFFYGSVFLALAVGFGFCHRRYKHNKRQQSPED